jgi:hypothetical protein
MKRNARPRIRATPQIGPITVPAIAAPERLLWFDKGTALGVIVITLDESGAVRNWMRNRSELY